MAIAKREQAVPELCDGQEYLLYHLASDHMRTPEFHSHDFYEIYFFMSGNTSVYIEEFAYRMKAGDVVIFPPGRMHRAFFHQPDMLYERLFIYISEDALEKMGTDGFRLVEILEERSARGQFHYHLNEEEFESCMNVFHEVIACRGEEEGAPYLKVLNWCRVTMMMVQLCKWLSESEDEVGVRSMGRMAEVIAYINEHICEDLSLDRIGGKFFISKYHLIREFKGYTNRTVYQYILSKRIILAKQYLQMGMGAADACGRCGFRDYSSFFKLFKRETGLSPQQYAQGQSSKA